MNTNRKRTQNERGSILILFTLMLILLLAFIGVALDFGHWYLVRAEMSKTVDAAALLGARNLGNPNVDAVQLAQEVATENFATGSFGTIGGAFTATRVGNNTIQVVGTTTVKSNFLQVADINDLSFMPIKSTGQAKQNQVEIMLVLDRSGSMGGQPIADLKTAANNFVNFFTPTQAQDHMGLITFATCARVDRAMGNNFVGAMDLAINNMQAVGWTVTEDGIAQAAGPKGFTNQAGVPQDQKIQQFMLLFSDGQPTAFRGNFLYNGVNYDAVIGASCDEPQNGYPVQDCLYSPTVENSIILNRAYPTGDGVAGSTCANSVRWYMLDTYPVPGYAPTFCSIPGPHQGPVGSQGTFTGPLAAQDCWIAENLCYANATTLKNSNVGIYSVAFLHGTQAEETVQARVLSTVASAPDMYYSTHSSGDLNAILQHVAEDIKLKLVQ